MQLIGRDSPGTMRSATNLPAGNGASSLLDFFGLRRQSYSAFREGRIPMGLGGFALRSAGTKFDSYSTTTWFVQKSG